MDNYLSSYLTGVTNMASACSKGIGPSFIEVDCFKKKNYKLEFYKLYEIKDDVIDLEIVDYSLEDILLFWLKDKELVSNLLYLIRFKIGEPLVVYTNKNNKILDLISRESGGVSMFYMAEDIYFVEFKNYMVCFTLGNNE